MENMSLIAERLIKRRHEFLAKTFEPVKFTDNPNADKLLNDLENYPHEFVLSYVMDKPIMAKIAIHSKKLY